MSTDLRDDLPPGRSRENPGRVPGPSRDGVRSASRAPSTGSFWALVPRRNLRRALFLILALGAVLAVKRSGGGFFNNVIQSVAPAPARTSPAPAAPPVRDVQTTVHLQAGPADR